MRRGLLEKARRDLALLAKGLAHSEPLELPEPDEESMQLARKYFDNGFRLMSSL